MSETQVIEQTQEEDYTTEVESFNEDEEKEEKEEKVVGLETEQTTSTLQHNEESTYYDEKHDNNYDNQYEDDNSEAVSITSSKLQEFPSDHLREKSSMPLMSDNVNNIPPSTKEDFGQCTECNRPNTGEDNWCKSCNSEHFRSQFGKWKSGNDNVDKVIKNAQLAAKNNKYVLEWIPYNKFKDVNFVAKGGYGTVYSTYWMDGPILGWDKELKNWKRNGTDIVALKRIHNSQFINMEFLDQIVKTQLQLHDNRLIIQYYGITQYPETNDYMIVMEYANQGSIRSYLNGRFNTMNWDGKLDILSNMARGLDWIHGSGCVHYSFHAGNVLRTGTGETIITDTGIKKPTIKYTSLLREKEEIYGVLPYLAPEVLYSKKFTSASDVYSFGVLMNEIISGLPPFNNVSHDNQLAAEVCQGTRPQIPMYTPKLLMDLIKRCWETKPSNRPSAKELKDSLNQWLNELKNDPAAEINAQCKASEESSRNSATFTPTPLLYVSHPEAVYHSRLLEFSKLPKPTGKSKLSSSLPYSETRQVDPAAYDNTGQDDDQNEDASVCCFGWFYKKDKDKHKK